MDSYKKYFYLKLKENFFDTNSIKILEQMPYGSKMILLLIKLYLCSLKDEGRLCVADGIPYTPKQLSSVTGFSEHFIIKALQAFESLGLVTRLPNGMIYINDIQSYIGESSSEADRKRAYRKRIKSEQLGCGGAEDDHPDSDETYVPCVPPAQWDISPTEKEKEKEKNTELFSESDADIRRELSRNPSPNAAPVLDGSLTDEQILILLDKLDRRFDASENLAEKRIISHLTTGYQEYMRQRHGGMRMHPNFTYTVI